MLGVVVGLGTLTLKAGLVGFGTVAATEVTAVVKNPLGLPVNG